MTLSRDTTSSKRAGDESAGSPRGLVGALFNSRAVGKIYAFLADHRLWAEQNLKLLHYLAPDAPNDPTIVDLGAGTGIGTLAMAEALDGRGDLLGVDFSSAMIERARRNLARRSLANVRFEQGDATRLSSIEDASVDLVVAHSFLYLVPDKAQVLVEARRILKPTGRLVFMEPREEGSFAAAALRAVSGLGRVAHHPMSSLRLACAMTAWRVMSGLEGRPTEAQLTRLFDGAGFEEVRFEPTLGGIGHHVIAR